jgi:Photosynthetic reaction centre cytochrome C subunit
MIAMVRQAETYFGSTAGVYPRGYHEVDCMTCHRGSAKTEPKAAKHFLNRRDAAGAVPPKEEATNLTVLPRGTEVHGAGSIMEDFRDALNVDCAYCHGGPVANQASDSNPRKEFSRKMILLTRQLNTNFPGTGVYPAAPVVVTCNTCHRGDVHPVSIGNKNYDPIPAAR